MGEFALPLIANVSAQLLIQIQPRQLTCWFSKSRAVFAGPMYVTLADKGCTQLVEVGSGKVLSGLAKRIDPRLSCHSVQAAHSIKALLILKKVGYKALCFL